MDKATKGWIYNYSRRNFWRVATWYDYDDLVQDGHMCYYRTLARYVRDIPGERRLGTAKDPKHIMALFKIIFIQHVHNLSNAKLKQIDSPTITGQIDCSVLCPDADMDRFIAELPRDIALIVRKLNKADGRAWRKPFRRRSKGVRETTNDRLCRLLGLDPVTHPQIRSELLHHITV